MAHTAKTRKVKLDDSRHSIKIQYFQGPRYQTSVATFRKRRQFQRGNFSGK